MLERLSGRPKIGARVDLRKAASSGVVFNGARVTERNVDERLRRWNAMGS
jgi:hypothetical protein